jgi:beta-glucosidase
MAEIATPIDFLGINYYQGRVVAATPDGGGRAVYQDDAAHTDMGWEVAPDGLYELLVRIHDDYAPPAIVITENGAAYCDARTHDGKVNDPERAAYVAAHVEALRRAIAAGVPVQGYYVWTLLDNFEWAEGYTRRFGLVHVDFPTLERVPKASFSAYRDLIARERALAHAGAGVARAGAAGRAR